MKHLKRLNDNEGEMQKLEAWDKLNAIDMPRKVLLSVVNVQTQYYIYFDKLGYMELFDGLWRHEASQMFRLVK